MTKLAFVINGSGGAGKDTLCDFAARAFSVKNESSVTPVKALAAQVGWHGEKTDRARKFLSDLKALMIAHNDYPTVWATEQYRDFMASDQEIMFFHIREAEEIDKFIRATNGKAKALLIRRAAVHQGAYGNRSDDEVENYTYDYVFDNDLPIEEARAAFTDFLRRLYDAVKE
jgi:hypothetical protein